MTEEKKQVNNVEQDSAFDENGRIRYGLVNDYMFRMVLQKNLPALKNIVAAVLHISPDTIKNIEVTNTVAPGATIDDKEYRMDILIMFNDNSRVDIEMQVYDEGDWSSRSLHYLCREYEDFIKRGEEYGKNQTALQIGFLDFTLFKDHVKFFSEYKMCDTEDNYIYNGNFALYVIDLSQIDLATKADVESGLEKWCRLIKAKTLKELEFFAKEDKIMESVVQDIVTNNSDYAIRKRAQDREEYLRREAYRERRLKEVTSEIESLKNEKAALEKEKEELIKEVEKLRQLVDNKQ